MTIRHPYSQQAKEVIEASEVFNLGQPSTADEWAALRAEIESALDLVALMSESFDFTVSETVIADVPVSIYRPGRVGPGSDRLALFLHGSAYVVGSPRTAASLVVPVACAMNTPCLVPDYGLAPERPFPGGLNDALAVYRALVTERSPGTLSVFGSSAGGALAISMLLEAHREGLPMPGALGLVSPWSELGETGDSYQCLKGKDPVIDYELTLAHAAKLYAGEHDPVDPLISPVHADFPEGFPPTLIQTGTRDLFLSNCARLHHAMREHGVNAAISVFEGMWHAFQITPGLPEAEKAARELAAFLVDPETYFSPQR